VRIASSPAYIDTSALAKVYAAEPESAAVEAAVAGRRDLIVSDLAVSELTSLFARRVRTGQITPAGARFLYRTVLRDVVEKEFRSVELTRSVHREAERLMMTLGNRLALRAADGLHLALAAAAGARTLVTFDGRMVTAARALGTFELVE